MRSRRRVVVLLAVVAIALAGRRLGCTRHAAASSTIEELFRQQRSGIWVEGAGTVSRLLRDDTEVPRHQQWILRLPSGHTLKFAHNTDLAPRIDPLRVGDSIQFRGRYEFNEKGGVIHWTHRDPQSGQSRGWIEHSGRRYE